VSRSPNTPVRVLVVQDHPLLAAAIARLLESEEDLTVCGIARNGEHASVLAADQNPAVVLMDFRLPDLSGPAAAAKIRSAVPTVAIVFHSAEDSDDALLDAIDAGAIAYLTKSATGEEIVEAVRKAAVGETLIPARLFAMAIARQQRAATGKRARDRLLAEFTPRELDVLREMAEGHDTQTIAMRLGIAAHTVEWHVTHLISKLHVHSKLQAVIAAARLGLIEF
jgi:DNA-binding NarL/FixJ family response regulator